MTDFKKLIGFILSLLITSSGTLRATGEIKITGNLPDAKDGTIVYLYIRDRGWSFPYLANDTIKDGTFAIIYHDTCQEPRKGTLSFSAEDGEIPELDIWISSGKEIEITGTGLFPSKWNVKSDLEEQKEDNEYKIHFMDLLLQSDQLSSSTHKKIKEFMAAPKEEHPVIGPQINEMQSQQETLRKCILQAELDLLENKPYLSGYWMYKLCDHILNIEYDAHPEPERAIAIYHKLTEKEKSTKYGKIIETNLSRPDPLKPGDQIIDADFRDPDGRMHHLRDYLGKPILLNFWSAGCYASLQSLPEMKEMTEEYREMVNIIGVSMDLELAWKIRCPDLDISWLNLNDLKGKDGISLHYGIKEVPHYIIISPEGIILHSWSGYGKGTIRKQLEKWTKEEKQ